MRIKKEQQIREISPKLRRPRRNNKRKRQKRRKSHQRAFRKIRIDVSTVGRKLDF